MDASVVTYLEALPSAQRALFERVHRLVLEAHPAATVGLAYRIPTYVVGGRRLHIGAWKHGLSLYGWREGRAADFLARHPDLRSGKATIRLSLAAADTIPDAELRELVRATLAATDE